MRKTLADHYEYPSSDGLDLALILYFQNQLE
jgi:hypothetical protein